MKAGLLFEITRRLVGGTSGASGSSRSSGAGIRAAAAPLLAFVPVYFLGSFVQYFFFAQVISETCAIGMVLASVLWLEAGRRRDLVLASACGVGVVLAWPVWIGPGAATFGVAVLLRPSSWRDRIVRVTAVMAPVVVCLGLHQIRHPGASGIVTAAGAVTAPSVPAFGAGFLALALIGAGLAFGDPRARVVLAMLAATLLQAAALAALSVRAGSASFYLPFKMMYLAILPAAILGALALARAAALVSTRLPRARLAASCLPLAVAVLMVRGHVPVRRVHGSLSIPARDVALWAIRSRPSGVRRLLFEVLAHGLLAAPRRARQSAAVGSDAAGDIRLPGCGRKVDRGPRVAICDRRRHHRHSSRGARRHDPDAPVRHICPRAQQSPCCVSIARERPLLRSSIEWQTIVRNT